MFNTNYLKLQKNRRKEKDEKSPEKTNFTLFNTKSLSLNDLISHSPKGKNKSKLVITSLLSSSKRIIINRSKYNSSSTFSRKNNHLYPYRPNNSRFCKNMTKNEEKMKFILTPRTNDSVHEIKDYMSKKSVMIPNKLSTTKYIVKYEKIHNYFRTKKIELIINGDSTNIISSIQNSKNKENTIEDNKNNYNDNKIIDELPIDESKFLNFVDEINKDNNYINICKKNLKEYFIIDEVKNRYYKSFFERLS